MVSGWGHTPVISRGVYLLTRAASPQFSVPVSVRVIRTLDRSTYDGWVWIEVYQLNQAGDATARRTLFVRAAGMEPVQAPAARASRPRSGVVRPRA